MAADDETCHGNANFAIICSFISKFGEEFGLPNSIPALQRMLEDTENVDDELKEIHIKLLRKARKWFNKEKWERALVKFCHEYSSVDAWEIERFGYKKAKLSVKLELLKRLLELQFDCNAKFKGEVNKLDAISLRVLPVGRDLNGHMYWYQLDKECNLRLYMQEVEDETSWKLLCSTKQDLETLLENLGSKIDRKDLKEAAEDEERKVESNDTKEMVTEEVKPAMKSETEIKCETIEDKSEESKVLEPAPLENVIIKQEVDEKVETSESDDKECSMVKQGDSEHQSVISMDVSPVIASDISGNKIPLKDCTINLQSDNINLDETNDQNYVIKTVTPDSSESKANNSSLGNKEETVLDKPPDKVHLTVPEVQDKPEKEACKNVEPSNGKSIEQIVSSLAERSEVLDHLCESKKGDTIVEKSANAKQSDSEPRKLVHEGPVEERLSSMVKSSFAEGIVGKHLSESLPFSGNVAVKEAHSTKVNSAITTSLLSESVNTLLDHRNVMDSKKQGEHRVVYKGPPPIKSVSLCDEVPMDLSTTGRSRESKNEPFIIPRPEHEVPGNYKTESFITKIERQLTKMCEDNESIKFHRNDRFPFSSKHHKLRRNESFRKLHSKSIDQLQLNKMNIEKQNLGNQTNVSVIVGEKFLTKESVEQPRQSVICEIKNSKLISNEKIHEQSDSSNHLTGSGIANSHCVSSVTQKSGLQPIEKGPDQHDKGVIQLVGSISPPDKTFLSPRTESFNNITVSERKNLGFRKCLLNEFKADKSSSKLASSSSQMLVKDKLGDTRSVSKLEDARQLNMQRDYLPLNKLEGTRSPSILEDVKLLSEKMYGDPKLVGKVAEQSISSKKCADSELKVRKHNSEELKPVCVSNEKCEITEPISKLSEKQVEKDLFVGTKSSSEDKSLSKEINCKQSEASNKEETCKKQHSHKDKKIGSENLQREEKCMTKPSQKEEKCMTEPSQKEEKHVTGPPQKDKNRVTEPPQKGKKRVAEPPQKDKKRLTEPPQKDKKCVTESPQKEEKRVTEPPQKEEKCVSEPPQKEKCVTEPPQEEEKQVTEPPQEEEKQVTEPPQKEEKQVTEPPQKKEKHVTEPSQKKEKRVTEPLQKEEKHVTELPQKEEEKCVTESLQKKEKHVTESSQKEEKHVTEPSQEEERKCVTEPSQQEEECLSEHTQEEGKCLSEHTQEEGKCLSEHTQEEEKCVTEPSQKEGKCVTEPSQKEEKCVTEPSQKKEKCVTEPSQKKEKHVTEPSQEEGKCVTEPSQEEEKCLSEHTQEEEKCVTDPSHKEEQYVPEYVRKDKSKDMVGAHTEDDSSELKSQVMEEACNLPRLFEENHCKENEEATKGDKSDLNKLDGKDEACVSAGSKQKKCDVSSARKKDSSKKNKGDVSMVRKKVASKKSKCDIGTTRKKEECKQSSYLKSNCKEIKDTVQAGEQVMDSPLQADKASKFSHTDSDTLERKKDLASEAECQQAEKVEETCDSSKRVAANKTANEGTQAITSECETKQGRKVHHSDESKKSDCQSICQTEQSAPISVDSKVVNVKKHSSVDDVEPCLEIPKLDQEVDVKLGKNVASDAKSDGTPEEGNSHVREKQLNENDTAIMHAGGEGLKTDAVEQQISEVDSKAGVPVDERLNETEETKCKDSENESGAKKLDEDIGTKNGDPLKKDHETGKSDKALDDEGSLEKHAIAELVQKEVLNEERAQVRSKLRRSSRTSRGCSEAPKCETENHGLCKNEAEKNKDQVNEQKHNEVTENDSSCQKYPDVNTNAMEKESDEKKLESTELGRKDTNDKKCEIAGTEKIQGNENKQRKSEKRSSKTSSRRSRNSRKSVRNVPKADISCEAGVTSTLGDKSISNSEVTVSDPALHLSVSSEKLGGLKIKFSPPKKNVEISKDLLFDIGISGVCLESKIKCKSDIKVVNNKHFKSKVKESFCKKLDNVGSKENPICIDQEESFTVGRMRTRGRLKRECSAVAPPPPREPVVKNKPAAPSPNKTPQSSQNRSAAKSKAQQSRASNAPTTTPRKRVRGKRSSLSKTPLPDSILEIIGSSEEKSLSKNDKMKKSNDKKSTEIVATVFPVVENSESESIPIKRSRRIQEQNQKKISQLAVEMEQEQRRLEKLAKQNAAVAKNKQKEVVEKTPKPQPLQQQARCSKKTNKSEAKQPDPALADLKNTPRKTRNRSRNLTKMTLIYEDDSKDAEYETSRDTIKSRRRRNGRRGRKKKYKPWDLSSESSSPSEEITEEEEEEEQEELLVFNTNEDEFACEEIDESAEPVIVRRARTAKKVKSASESESEADNEPAPDDKPCARCGKYDEPEWILLCDKCDAGYHTRCLAPPLMIIPDGDWYCPPCEHAFLVDNLLIELRKLEQMLKQREREELRKQRLAYVGISLDNVLKPEKKEKQENESYEEDDESDESSEEDRIYSKRSSRTRRVVNYQFKEFDELIQSAIEEEMMEFRLVPEKPEGGATGATVDSNEDSEADVVAPSRRKKKAHRLNDLDFTDVEDSDEEYKGSSMSETEVSQSPQSDGSNSEHSGSSASWGGGRKTRSSKQNKHHKRKRSRNSVGDSDYVDGESFRPTTRRAAQKNISYRELSSDEEWGDDKPKKPTVKKWTKKRRQSSTSSESSGESFGRRRSKKARIVQKWKKSESDTESEPKKARSSSRKWEESESESESKETRKKAYGVQRWEDSESASDSGSRRAKKTRTVQKWEGSESDSESDSKKSSSSDSESSGTSVQSTEKWKIKKSSEGNGIKININRKVLDSDSDDSTSGQARQKKKNVSRIVDSEDSEESYDDASKKVSDEESTSESNAGQIYKDDKAVSVKNVPSNSVKDVKSGPQITVTDAEKVPETVADQGPPKAALQHVGIHFKGNASPSMQKVMKNVKPLGRSLMKSDSEHKNFDSSISETFSNDSQSLQGLPAEHEEPMCESDSEPDPKLNRFSNDQYICKTEIFEKDSVYRPAKEDQSFNYTTAEEKSYQIPYTGLSSLQDYPSRPSPLKPSMVETYSNSTSPSKLTPLDSYSEASSPKGFISLDSCSSFRKSSSFVSTDPEAKPRPILTSENYQGEIRFPPEQYPPYERPSHLSPATCPSSPAAFPQSPSARENASPPRLYSQYPEPYAGQRSPDYYHSQQYYGREESVPRQNYVSNYSSSENVSPYPYNTNSSQQPNGGFMIDTLLRSRNPDGEEDELTGVTDIVSYITQE